MQKICERSKVKELIEHSKMAVLYFTGMDCGACEAIKLKIEQMLNKYNKIQSCEVDGEKYLDICAEYGVFSVPIFLLFIDGKECISIGRNVDLLDLESKINRYYHMIFQ